MIPIIAPCNKNRKRHWIKVLKWYGFRHLGTRDDTLLSQGCGEDWIVCLEAEFETRLVSLLCSRAQILSCQIDFAYRDLETLTQRDPHDPVRCTEMEAKH
jgi:hypothetical protein